MQSYTLLPICNLIYSLMSGWFLLLLRRWWRERQVKKYCMILASQVRRKENHVRLPESWDCLIRPEVSDSGLNKVLCMWKYLKVRENQMLFNNPSITPLWGFTFSAQSSWCFSGQHIELQALQTTGSPVEGQVSSAACCNSQSPWEEVPRTSSRPSPLTIPLLSWRETAEGSLVHKYWRQRSKKGFTFISKQKYFRSYLNLGDLAGNSFLRHLFDLLLFTKNRQRPASLNTAGSQQEWLLSQLQVSLLPQLAQELLQLSALQSQRMFSY